MPDPRDAWLGREVREDLRALARSGRVQVALLSGRGLQDLQTRVGLADLNYGGCHGLEVEGPGLAFEHPAAARAHNMLQELAQALAQRTATIPGVRVEPKRLAVAVHYRNMPPPHRDRLEAEIGGVLRPYASVRRLIGHQVVTRACHPSTLLALASLGRTVASAVRSIHARSPKGHLAAEVRKAAERVTQWACDRLARLRGRPGVWRRQPPDSCVNRRPWRWSTIMPAISDVMAASLVD